MFNLWLSTIYVCFLNFNCLVCLGEKRGGEYGIFLCFFNGWTNDLTIQFLFVARTECCNLIKFITCVKHHGSGVNTDGGVECLGFFVREFGVNYMSIYGLIFGLCETFDCKDKIY